MLGSNAWPVQMTFLESGTSLLVEQLKGFPSHKFRDGPDALEMCIRIINRMIGGKPVAHAGHYEEIPL